MLPAIKRAQFWAQSLWGQLEWARIGDARLALAPPTRGFPLAWSKARPRLFRRTAGLRQCVTSFKLSTWLDTS
jgi:hypothetical protein